MLNINIVCIGKIKENFLRDSILEYSKRLKKYCSINILEVPDEKIPSKVNDKIISDIKTKECEKIFSYIKRESYVISLDLTGSQLTSEEFSKKIENISLNYSSSITFIIGGTLGLTNEILKKSDEILCFSRMTFPHQLIRVFLLEQLFRAFKISKNETYHW